MSAAAKQVLYVGNRATSSWSLRAFLALDLANIDVDVVEIDLKGTDAQDHLRAVGPSGLVPVLHVGTMRVWDSLSIMEWAAEIAPALWPAHARRRAVARSIVAEVHGGMTALRNSMPMNWFARQPVEDWRADPAAADIERVRAIWQEHLIGEAGGRFLFGDRPCLADVAFVPIASRFKTYGVQLDEPELDAYAKRLLTLKGLNAWFQIPSAQGPRRRPDPPATAVPAPTTQAISPDTERAGAKAEAKPRPAVSGRSDSPLPFEEVVRRARAKSASADDRTDAERIAGRRRPPAAPAEPDAPLPAMPSESDLERAEDPAATPATGGWLGGFDGLGWLRRRRPPPPLPQESAAEQAAPTPAAPRKPLPAPRRGGQQRRRPPGI